MTLYIIEILYYVSIPMHYSFYVVFLVKAGPFLRLDSISKFSIGASFGGFVSSVLVYWMLLLVFFVCPFAEAMDGGRSFMRSSIRLVHVSKYHLLMPCRGFG